MSEKGSKGRFLNSKIIVTNKEKERRKRKSEEKERGRRKTSNGCTLSVIIPTLEIVFDRKKLFDTKGPFGDNVIKNPARYILTLSLTLKYPLLTCHNTFEFFTSI